MMIIIRDKKNIGIPREDSGFESSCCSLDVLFRKASYSSLVMISLTRKHCPKCSRPQIKALGIKVLRC